MKHKDENEILKQNGYKFIRRSKHGRIFRKGVATIQLPFTPYTPRPIKYLLDDILQWERKLGGAL